MIPQGSSSSSPSSSIIIIINAMVIHITTIAITITIIIATSSIIAIAISEIHSAGWKSFWFSSALTRIGSQAEASAAVAEPLACGVQRLEPPCHGGGILKKRTLHFTFKTV